ncbi:tetratricopeptide repeat protein [Pseudothermotoga thermarum]|uniref:Tetratricopeptide TPR_1 repeat-containing protein n=1 Tax=Pseudothermotoga thermarum DSM 5069 TaxID=688269 RepID=F7YVB7_9THEM|nr:tetratricopeptide repeat protein [Pseudothermotoga thermarum]AEH50420.1 Tetratricopeptide TPR_1 repeat-containing protein [Pseudothermotoga thermarum DSM 5069]
MSIEEIFQKAVQLSQDGQFEEAEKLYKQCLEIEPGHPEIWNNLGNIYRRVGQIAKSIEAYQKAIELDSSYAPAYLNLACTLLTIDRYDMAKLVLLKLVNMNFQVAKSLAMLVVCHLQLNEQIEALKLFRENKDNQEFLNELEEYGVLNYLFELDKQWSMI